jgi:hypothetical protein
MTDNGLDIQTIFTKRTDFQTDRIFQLGQVTEKRENANPSHFLKFLLPAAQMTHLVLPVTQAYPSANAKHSRTPIINKQSVCETKRAIFAYAPTDYIINSINL